MRDDGEDPATGGEPLLVEPVSRDFEYVVRRAVAIPLVWATLLKAAGEHHYDWKCREMAARGVVNALYNDASFNEDPEHVVDDAAWPSTHPVAWNDCDGMLKILEQTRMVDSVTVGEIRAWLDRVMGQIAARHREISLELNDVVASLSEIVRRTQLLQRNLALPDAAGIADTQVSVVRQMLERAEFQSVSALILARRVSVGGVGRDPRDSARTVGMVRTRTWR